MFICLLLLWSFVTMVQTGFQAGDIVTYYINPNTPMSAEILQIDLTKIDRNGSPTPDKCIRIIDETDTERWVSSAELR